jgi:hypothetical protein
MLLATAKAEINTSGDGNLARAALNNEWVNAMMACVMPNGTKNFNCSFKGIPLVVSEIFLMIAPTF